MLRITGGTWKGRALRSPSSQKTRPSHARLRQALFNSIQFEIEGKHVLDLFAGSGALGFEALSRGAMSVTFVESGRPALDCIRKNIQELQCADRVKVKETDVDLALRHWTESVTPPFHLIFSDPPYDLNWEQETFPCFSWDKLLTPHGKLILEWGGRSGILPDRLGTLVKVREKTYGDSVLTTFICQQDPINESAKS